MHCLPPLIPPRVQRLFAVAVLLAVLAPAAPAQDLRELFRKSKHSVVVLNVYDGFGGTLGEGSGFFVDPDGIIVTNYHVIEHGRRVEAVLANERALEVAGILAVDEANDLALLKVDEGPYRELQLAGRNAAETGERVVVLGNPLGLAASLSEGIVSAVRTEGELSDVSDGPKVPRLQITAAISPGSSGSPVMNLDGEVLGVAVSYVSGGQNLNFAVPVAAVYDLLDMTDLGAAPEAFGGAQQIVQQVEASTLVRNLVISAVFFFALWMGFRRLR